MADTFMRQHVEQMMARQVGIQVARRAFKRSSHFFTRREQRLCLCLDALGRAYRRGWLRPQQQAISLKYKTRA